MAHWIVGIAALATLLMSAARGARAQAAVSWPSPGTQLIRIDDPSRAPALDVTSSACAPRLRDLRTGREYLLRRSRAQTEVAQHHAGATTSTTTRLLRAVGEYSRLELKGDTLSTRVVTVDCLTSRVVARRAEQAGRW
jgi:hypothetical protein